MLAKPVGVPPFMRGTSQRARTGTPTVEIGRLIRRFAGAEGFH